MDVDNWLKTVEKKLQLGQCNNREKVMLSSHQLIGLAAHRSCSRWFSDLIMYPWNHKAQEEGI
jgi:hypothetical protein